MTADGGDGDLHVEWSVVGETGLVRGSVTVRGLVWDVEIAVSKNPRPNLSVNCTIRSRRNTPLSAYVRCGGADLADGQDKSLRLIRCLMGYATDAAVLQ